VSRRRVTGVAAAALAVLLLGGCGDTVTADQQPLPPAYPVAKRSATATTAQAQAPDTATTEVTGGPTDTTAAPPAKKKTAPAANTILSPADKTSFAALQRSLGSPIGLAVSGAGLGQRVEVTGTLRDVIAWSTSKVPIAMAIYAAGLADSQQSNLHAAITASDNAAAERLWAALGSADTAARAADAQLQAAGDTHTAMESRTLRSGYTPFGQTDWKLTDQARFTAGMPCSDAGGAVLALMHDTIAAQRWGLGSVGGSAEIKGGWGPGTRPGVGGGYLDRQMGLLFVRGKPLAVTIAALPADGQHGTGTSQLTRIAKWLVAHANVRGLPARARCG
jgi:hypothetical protein